MTASHSPWWRRPWIVPLMVATALFLAASLPPYLSLDPGRARLAPLPDHPWFYPVMVTHIFLGTIVLVTACLQLWPWLRRQHPRIHRWSGRTYVCALVPAALCTLAIAPLGREGPNQQVANVVLGLLWLVTTLSGWRAARRRRFGAHREWMIRSIALSFSIVTNRFWVAICLLVFAPESLTGTGGDPAARAQAVGVATWASWVVNLLIAEWWLHRRPVRRGPVRRGPKREDTDGAVLSSRRTDSRPARSPMPAARGPRHGPA